MIVAANVIGAGHMTGPGFRARPRSLVTGSASNTLSNHFKIRGTGPGVTTVITGNSFIMNVSEM